MMSRKLALKLGSPGAITTGEDDAAVGLGAVGMDSGRPEAVGAIPRPRLARTPAWGMFSPASERVCSDS